MRKQYAMSSDEFIPLHPNHINAFRTELVECIHALGFVADALSMSDDTGKDIAGGQEVLSLLYNQFVKLHEKIEPENLRAQHEKWQAEFGKYL